MSENKYSKAVQAMFATGAAFVINYGINLILTPFITDTVGTEAYGFVSLAKQFAQYAVIITSALNSFAARYIAIEYHKKNKRKANKYFSSVFYGDIVLATGIMAAAILGIIFLGQLLNISVEIIADVKLLFFFTFVNFWITTVFTVYSSSAYIKNKLDVTGVFRGISYLAEALTLFIAYRLLPAKVFYVGIGLTIAAVVVAGSNVWICRKNTPDLIVNRKEYSGSIVKKLVLDGIWTSINSLGELLNSGLDLIVCNLMLSPLAMGQLAIAKTIQSIFQGLFVLVGQAFQPMFLKSYAEENRGSLLRELKLSMKISGMLSNIGFAGFAALGLAYYKLWIPDQDITLIYKLTVISIMTSIPGGPMQPLYYIYTLTVKKMIPCIITIIGGIFNVVGMLLLITYTDMGIYAVVWTTAIVMMVINFITNPLYMAYVLHLPWHTFYPNIIRNIISCAVLLSLFRTLSAMYMPDNWLTLFVCMFIYAALGAGVHMCIVCERRDWKEIKTRMRRYEKKND